MAGLAAVLVLAAGQATRFGSAKALAPLAGRPVLDHVLGAAIAADADRILVVLPPGRDGDGLQAVVAAVGAGSVRNRRPERGLASSVALGLGVLAADEAIDRVAVLPGDQPLVAASTIRAVLDALAHGDRPVAVARHAGDGTPNPVAIRRDAFDLVGDLDGDRGLAPLIARQSGLVTVVDVPGTNPDIDTPGDLLAADWALRVRANREQVDRVREVPDAADFYAPVSRLFRDDPNRTSDPVLDVIRSHVAPEDVVLDVGAGAGRYALPLARVAREVIAVDPSTSMLAALREDAAAHGIRNVRAIEGRWPPRSTEAARGPDDAGVEADPLVGVSADVSLIAHVGYDVEAIGPFLDALEAATRRTCVAVMMDRTPAAVAAPFWPLVHGEPRAQLPALDELVALLEARGTPATVATVARPAHPYATREDAFVGVERQLWVAPGGYKHRRLVDAFDAAVTVDHDGWWLERHPGLIGIVSWAPRPAAR